MPTAEFEFGFASLLTRQPEKLILRGLDLDLVKTEMAEHPQNHGRDWGFIERPVVTVRSHKITQYVELALTSPLSL